jgi:hypothetical protein
MRARGRGADRPAGDGGAVRPTRESTAHGGGRRYIRRGAQTDGRGRASACVRPRTAAEPMWHVRQTSRAAFAFPRDSVSVCPYLNEFYSKFCN